jgi:lysophospholipase L1-like esterase
MAIQLTSATKVLLIGDSITDAGWKADAEQMGSGYVRLIRDYLRAKDPKNAPQVINRGIGGNRVVDLAARWKDDVLALAPDVLSIMIGINDVWHKLAGWGAGCPIEEFIPTYRTILTQTKEKLPRCKLVLCEPTVISPPQHAEGNRALQPYVKATHDLAKEFSAEVVVPLHTTFFNAQQTRPDIDWASDGVHPTTSGHMLIARTWLASTGTL